MPISLSFVPPQHGDKVVWRCCECGAEFFSPSPKLPFLGGPKCHECGSPSVEKDARVRY